MSYFAKFPLFVARLNGEQKIMTDLFIRPQQTTSEELLLPYVILDGERIEDVAYKIYGNVFYHWIIWLINGIVNPREEWPIRQNELPDRVTRKYGPNMMGSVHHYQTVAGQHEITGYANLLNSGIIEPVTNYQYEEFLNDTKRQIKVLDPKYLSQFVANFDSVISA